MKYMLKLVCPMCGLEFKTKRRDKLWCSRSCAKRYYEIQKGIEINQMRQKQLASSDIWYYDIKSNKFYIKSMMPSV